MEIKSYHDLIVWQKSMELTRYLYRATEEFPKSELFGLRTQMRRAAVAIPSNIAEGYARKYRKEYRQFLLIAFSSGAELETQLILSKDLTFIDADIFNKLYSLLGEVRKMLNVMISRLTPTG